MANKLLNLQALRTRLTAIVRHLDEHPTDERTIDQLVSDANSYKEVSQEED